MDDSLSFFNMSALTGVYDVILFNPSAYIRSEIIEVLVNSQYVIASTDQETQFELHAELSLN